MQDEMEFEQLQPSIGASVGAADLRRLHDVPVELAVEIGRTRMTIGQTLELRPGSVVSLNRLAGEPVDLLVNGKPIARGEVVVIDEEFGLRVTDVVSPRDLEEEAAAAEVDVPALEHLGPVPGSPDDPNAGSVDDISLSFE